MLTHPRRVVVLFIIFTVLCQFAHAQNAPLFPGSVYDAGNMPTALAAGDFNGDSIPDIVTSNADTALVSHLGDGYGKFLTGVTTATFGVSANALVAADFNADGILDLAATLGGLSSSVVVVKGDGLGGFLWPLVLTAGSSANHLATGDLNNNGSIDIAVANVNSNNVSIFFWNGNRHLRRGDEFCGGNAAARGRHCTIERRRKP